MNAKLTEEDIKQIINSYRVESRNTFTDDELDKIEKIMIEGIGDKD